MSNTPLRERERKSPIPMSLFFNVMCYLGLYCHVWGLAWLIIVGSRFDDWIYFTSLLQLQLIITVDTFDSFLITDLSLYFFSFSDWSLDSYYLVQISSITPLPGKCLSFNDPLQTADRTSCLTVPLLFCVSIATVIRCCRNDVYLVVVWQQMLPTPCRLSATAYWIYSQLPSIPGGCYLHPQP
jgi:hypothetical protein